MTIGTRLMTWLKGEQVGTDQFGNRYFREKGGDRRWVLYKGEAEASKVPPEWHLWLHKTVDAIPGKDAHHKPWEQPHLPNLTGTTYAYRPAGHPSQSGQRPHATGDYEPWTP